MATNLPYSQACENNKTPILEKLRKIFCPKNQELAQFLLDRGLIKLVTDMPWLATATKRDLC